MINVSSVGKMRIPRQDAPIHDQDTGISTCCVVAVNQRFDTDLSITTMNRI